MSYFFYGYRTLVAALMSSSILVSAQTPKKATPSLQSVTQLDSRIAQLKNEIADISVSLQKARQDSASMVADITRQNSTEESRLNACESAVEKKVAEIAEFKKQSTTSRQDSLTLVAGFRQKSVDIRARILQYESDKAAKSAELVTISRRLEALQSDQGFLGDQTVAMLQRNIMRCDTQLAQKKDEIIMLEKKREMFRQDSLQAESSRAEERRRTAAESQETAGSLMAIDAGIANAAAKLKAARLDSVTAGDQEKRTIAGIIEQKNSITTRIASLNSAIRTNAAERQRIQQSIGALQTKYDQGRAPLTAALTTVDMQLKKRQREKESLVMLREKLTLDSAVAGCQKQLDSVLFLVSQRNRDAKRAQSELENELNTLSLKLDTYTRARRGTIEQLEARLQAQTIFQKLALTDGFLRTTENEIANLTAKRRTAESALTNFDETNPLASNPSIKRLTQLDTDTKARTSEIEELTLQRDSLSSQITIHEKNIGAIAASSFLRIWSADSVYRACLAEKDRATIQKNQIQLDNTTAEKSQAASIGHFRTELAAINLQIVSAEREVAGLTAERDSHRRNLLAAQDKNAQTKLSARQEKLQLDSSAAFKQKTIAMLAEQVEKVRQDSAALAQEFRISLAAASRGATRVDSISRRRDLERLYLSNQRDSVKTAFLTNQRKNSVKVAALGQEIATLTRQLAAKQAEIAERKSSLDLQVAGLKRERNQIDMDVAAIDRAVADLETQVKKSYSDSIAAESARRTTALRMSQTMFAKDTAIDAQNRLAKALINQVEQKKQDSVRVAGQYQTAIAPIVRSIRTCDSLIKARELEIAALRNQIAKARQDSLAENKRQAGALLTAHDDIIRVANQVRSAQSMASQLALEKQRVVTDSLAEQRANAAMVAGIKNTLANQSTAIQVKRRQKDALLARRSAVDQQVGAAEGSYSTPPAPRAAKPALPAGVDNAALAKKNLESIYSLLGEDRVPEAIQIFKTQNENLRKNLDPDAFQMLKMTIEQMAPGN
jgi:uncharacterized small protein (DUF1192 family)